MAKRAINIEDLSDGERLALIEELWESLVRVVGTRFLSRPIRKPS
jgi:hypothetical protein